MNHVRLLKKRYYYGGLLHFGKRFKHTDLATLQEQLRLQGIERKKKQKETDDDDSTGLANKGRLLVDATCW